MESKIKREDECCCCFDKEDLFNMLDPYNFEEKVEIYSTMIAECFQIELNSNIEESKRNLYLICKNCVFRLKDAVAFRSQVQIAYNRLQAENIKKDVSKNAMQNREILYLPEYYCKVEKDECSDFTETKENTLDHDNMQSDSNVDLKPLDKTTVASTRKTRSTDDTLLCNICNKRLRNVYGMQRHVKTHQKKCCDHCGKLYTSRSRLMTHVKTHLKEKFVCDMCERVFRRKRFLREHIMLHMGMHTVKCETCSKGFVSKVALGRHLRSYHVEGEPCGYCNKTFGDKNKLQVHIKSHLEEKGFPCDECGKILSTRKILKDHKDLKHSGRRIQCNMCEQAFPSRAMLLKHKRMHFNPQQYKCKHCDRTFANRLPLLAHEKTHLNVKEFVCNYCQKEYNCKSNFKNHIMSHTDARRKIVKRERASVKREKKDIKCDICEKSFTRRNLLTTHMAVHSDERKYICNYCTQACKTRHSIYDHIVKYCKYKQYSHPPGFRGFPDTLR